LQGKQAPLVHRNYVNSVDFSPDGRQLITGSDDQQARIWDLPLSCQRGIPLVKSNPALSLANLDPSLVAGNPRTRISGSQGRPIPHWVREYLCAAFSPDGRLVVTGSHDNLARVWEAATGRLVGKALPHQNWVRAVAFAPDNRRVLTGSHDMTARLWNVQTGEQLGPALHHAGEIVAVAISPDGTKGLTGSSDKTARLWNLNTGEAIGPAMLHADIVLSACFSDDGRFVLTAASGSANEVRLWDAATATQIGPPALHDRRVGAVLFDGGRRSFLTMSDDGAARRWPMPQPIAGDPDLVRLWTQTITGQELDAGKSVSVLETSDWRERRARVLASPLRSDLEAGADEVLAWHGNMLGANEISLVEEAALWHLDRLLAAHPGDWSLHTRQAGMLHRFQRDAQALKALAVARELGGLEPVRGWCAERAENLERIHQPEAALWFREWIVAVDPKDPQAHDDLGHCLARLGQLDKASDHFTHAVTLARDRINFQRDLALARLALDDRVGFRQACARLIHLAEATDSPESAYMAALACVFDSGAAQHWDAVVRLVARAAAAYEGDIRIHVAALFRAGRMDEALQRPWNTDERYTRFVWEWFFQGMLRLRGGRHEEDGDILERIFKMTDFMDQAMPRDAKSKVWSDWIYYVQCHALRKEAEALLRAAGSRKASPPR
jgi:tetratricopeptide (TPR) repeat protein